MISNVNPCNVLSLYSADNKCLGYCLDTPNAFAYACFVNDKIKKGVAKYPLFDDTIRYADNEDIKGRISMFKKQLVENAFKTYGISFI